MKLEALLLKPSIFDDVHVVEPDIFHATGEVDTRIYPIAGYQEIIDPSQVYLRCTMLKKGHQNMNNSKQCLQLCLPIR